MPTTTPARTEAESAVIADFAHGDRMTREERGAATSLDLEIEVELEWEAGPEPAEVHAPPSAARPIGIVRGVGR